MTEEVTVELAAEGKEGAGAAHPTKDAKDAKPRKRGLSVKDMAQSIEVRVQGESQVGGKQCASCNETKTKSEYSANQWKKASSVKPPKCKACSAAGGTSSGINAAKKLR